MAGFSEDDIAQFRRTFHSQSSGNYLDSDLPGDGEDCAYIHSFPFSSTTYIIERE